eukprot:3792806-Amphidinium_carterae.1
MTVVVTVVVVVVRHMHGTCRQIAIVFVGPIEFTTLSMSLTQPMYASRTVVGFAHCTWHFAGSRRQLA